jgi:hypothetical protein
MSCFIHLACAPAPLLRLPANQGYCWPQYARPVADVNRMLRGTPICLQLRIDCPLMQTIVYAVKLQVVSKSRRRRPFSGLREIGPGR